MPTALRRRIARTMRSDAANARHLVQIWQVECSTLHGNGFWKTRLFNLPYPPLGPPTRPLPRTSMDVYNTGQSWVAHSNTCCVPPTSVPKRPATLATTAGVEWSRIAQINVLSRICIISTYT